MTTETVASCMHCGSLPAAEVTLGRQEGRGWRSHRRSTTGPMCRLCGLALFRRVTDKTLVWGWWGIPAFFANFGVLAANLSARRCLAALGDPVRPPQATAPRERPLHPGPSLLARPGVWTAALLLTVAGLVLTGLAGAGRTGDARLAGRCIVFTADGTRLGTVVPCSRTHDAAVVEVSTAGEACPATTDGYFENRHNAEVLCVDTDA